MNSFLYLTKRPCLRVQSPFRQFSVQNPLADQPRHDFPHLIKSVSLPAAFAASANIIQVYNPL